MLVRMDNLVSSGSVPNGFYVASGTRELTRQVLTRVVDLFKTEFESSSLETAQDQQSHVGRLFWIDSGNSFDAFHVARAAAERRLDPKRVLRAIQVARPFTAFQFQQMLEKVPKASRLSLSPTESIQWRPLVIISDLMGLFYDDEIQEKDVQRAFRKFVDSLAALGDRALVIALCIDHSIPYQRRAFVSQALQAARRVNVMPPISIPVHHPLPLVANGGW